MCGDSRYGQLGSGNRRCCALPRMNIHFMGDTFTQVVCGGNHVLAFRPSNGRIYGFGSGSCGQLGNGTVNDILLPRVMLRPWVKLSNSFFIFSIFLKKIRIFKVLPNGSTSYVKRIFAGGDRSFVTITSDNKENLYDSRVYTPNTQIECMTVDLIESCTQIDENARADLSLMASMEYIFKNVACINASFLLANDEHICCSMKNHGLNIEEATIAFKKIQTIKKEAFKEIVSFF